MTLPIPVQARRPSFDARELRETILRMALAGNSVHIACAFSIVEIVAVLYRWFLRLGDPPSPNAPDRDYLVLSKGHGVMAQYACLKQLGWLGESEFQNYFADGTRLTGLSEAHVPGLEVSSGSLGHGLSIAVGLALAAQRRASPQRVYAIVGDGEINEGAVWEALLLASQLRLDNLTVIVDANGLQAMGRTDDILALGDIGRKFAAFGLDVAQVDGHDEQAMFDQLSEWGWNASEKPRGLVAHTIKGKGVSFMENENRWHYQRLTAETFRRALAEIRGDRTEDPAVDRTEVTAKVRVGERGAA